MRASEFEIRNYDKLDRILSKLCELVERGQSSSKDYGMVAAAVLDPSNQVVARLNRPGHDGKRIHAEHAAMLAYIEQYGSIPEGSTIITTLSPCNEHMDERDGPSCTSIINQSSVKKVYCGYMDPTQDDDTRRFNLLETANKQIRQQCKAFADTFLGDIEEDYSANDTPPGPETPPTMPAGTVRVDVSDVYDWYKLGKVISNLKNAKSSDFGKGPPSTIMSFGSEDEEHKYLSLLKKLGLTTTDIDPIDPHQPKGMPRQKTDPTYNVNEFASDDGDNDEERTLLKYARMWYKGNNEVQHQIEKVLDRMGWEIGEVESEEGGAFVVQSGDEHGNSYIGFAPDDLLENFADGRNPQDKGDSKRHGINTKASVSSLRKTAKQGGRKGQLAHWLANMKSGRAKKGK